MLSYPSKVHFKYFLNLLIRLHKRAKSKEKEEIKYFHEVEAQYFPTDIQKNSLYYRVTLIKKIK